MHGTSVWTVLISSLADLADRSSVRVASNERTHNQNIRVKLNFNCLFTPDLTTVLRCRVPARMSPSVANAGHRMCWGRLREKMSSKIMLSHNYVPCRRLSSSHATPRRKKKTFFPPRFYFVFIFTLCVNKNFRCASFTVDATFLTSLRSRFSGFVLTINCKSLYFKRKIKPKNDIIFNFSLGSMMDAATSSTPNASAYDHVEHAQKHIST